MFFSAPPQAESFFKIEVGQSVSKKNLFRLKHFLSNENRSRYDFILTFNLSMKTSMEYAILRN